MTIASDDEIEPEEDIDSDSDLAAAAATKPAPLTKAGKKRQRQKAAAGAGAAGKKGGGLLDPTFSFDAESSNLGVAEMQAVKGWDFKSESLPPFLVLLALCFPTCALPRECAFGLLFGSSIRDPSLGTGLQCGPNCCFTAVCFGGWALASTASTRRVHRDQSDAPHSTTDTSSPCVHRRSLSDESRAF